MSILLTGSAGFIGFHLANNLSKKRKIIGIDNINGYYSKKLKLGRIKILKKNKNFIFFKVDITNYKKLNYIIKKYKVREIIHLAAQAGVRFSIKKPKEYLKTNVTGFFNILECCKNNNIKFLMYASSSSVYGLNNHFPLKEKYNTDFPTQFYAATKKSNEVMAHSYSSLYGIKTIGLRFFTVYGPWGRPDMAYFSFAKKILNKQPITVFNNGNHSRDFTYIDDAIDIVKKLYLNKKKIKSYDIFNISSGKRVELKAFIRELFNQFGKKTVINYTEKQLGDLKDTLSSKEKLKKIIKINKHTNYKSGLKKFVKWFMSYKHE